MGKIHGRSSRHRSRRRSRVLVGETEGAEDHQASHQPVDWHPRPEGADSPHSFLCSMSIAGRSCLPTQTLPVNYRSCNLEMTIELSRWRGDANHGETKAAWSRGGRWEGASGASVFNFRSLWPRSCGLSSQDQPRTTSGMETGDDSAGEATLARARTEARATAFGRLRAIVF